MGSDLYNFDFLQTSHVLKRILSATCLVIVSMAVIGGLQSAAAGAEPAKAADSAARCQALTGLYLTGVEITSASIVPAAPAGTVPFNPVTKNMIPVAMPEYCRVEGVVNRRKGAGGVEYGIGFALALPGNWNGRLVFQGGGAFNGTIRQPFGNACNPRDPALARGFAVISTDSGHKGEPFDTTFMRDQQAALDFAFNAVPTVTRLGKELVTAYFGRAPHHTYSAGCSTGGREGMIAAQRYPSLFDGVIAGDPAMRSAYTRIAGWNATIAFNRIAPRDAQGNPLRLQAFPAEDQKLLHAAVAQQCDALDGLKDGLILNLAACRFDPAVLQCEKGKNASCLSAEQITALKTAFGGPRDSQGNPLYTGFPYDLGLLGEYPDSPMNILPASVPGIYDNPPSPFTFDFAPEIARIRADPVQILSDTKDWTDIGTFYRRGGKIIFYNGASDPWFSFYDTLDYFQRNKEANPEFDSSRFYNIPGMGHCGEGGMEVFDMMTPLVDWVENGKAPEAIVATDWLRTGTTRPLCPWPRYGRYKGTGDPRDAANFECRGDLPASAFPASRGMHDAAASLSAQDIYATIQRIAAELKFWPGFDPRQVPLMLYDGKNTYLYGHPNPSLEFSALPDSNGVLSSPGLHEQVRANTMINFNGAWTATVMLPLLNDSNLVDQAAVCIHEMFHIFQMQHHPGWFANEAEFFMYPVTDSHLLALKRMETEMLVRASSAMNEADLVGWSKSAMATRQLRFALLASGAIEYERHIEGTEGLAQYIQVKASGNPDGVMIRPPGGFEPDKVRQSAYYSGIHLGLILDRLMPEWRERREEQDTLNLDDLLNEALTKRSEPAYSQPGDEMQAYEKQAKSDTSALVEERHRLLVEFLDAPGWSIELLADGDAPLFPQGFDPMNLFVIDSKQLIHQRYAKLGNATGQIETLNRWMLSIGKGGHQMFEGIIRALITGLKDEPKLTDKDGVLELSGEGINAAFRGAHLKREGQRITVVLPGAQVK